MRRLTIRRRKSYRRKEKYILIVMFFLIAPLVSIVLGKVISKKVIVPYISSNKEGVEESLNKNTEKVEEKVTELGEFNIYNIELKEFTDLASAEDFLKKLNSEGNLGYVSKASKYKVFTTITLNKEEVEKQLIGIKKKYPDSEIKSIQIQPKQTDVNEPDKDRSKEISSTINLINNIYKEELSMWINNISSTNYEEIKTKMNENNIKIEKDIEKYSDKINNDDSKTLYSIIKVNVDNRKSIIKEFDTKNQESIKKTYFNLIKCFFSYVNYYKI